MARRSEAATRTSTAVGRALRGHATAGRGLRGRALRRARSRCRAVLLRTLAAAVAQVSAKYGSPDPSAWQVDATCPQTDSAHLRPGGAGDRGGSRDAPVPLAGPRHLPPGGGGKWTQIGGGWRMRQPLTAVHAPPGRARMRARLAAKPLLAPVPRRAAGGASRAQSPGAGSGPCPRRAGGSWRRASASPPGTP